MKAQRTPKKENAIRTFNVSGEIGLTRLKELIRELGDGYLFRFMDDGSENVEAVSLHGHDRHRTDWTPQWIDERQIMQQHSVKQHEITYANTAEDAVWFIGNSESGDPGFDTGGFVFLVFRKEKMEKLVCDSDLRDMYGQKYFAYKFLDDPKKCIFGKIVVGEAPAERIFPEFAQLERS
ncbi:MAG: hypothetical protein KGI04_04595 [Candidatus Micrarchaeota archaeon]|nr:hypothetical protein [Candidatus Micrarchaeota archaeon]